ncbi:PAS domain-containing sensor histidine kinase [Sulfuricurvum sp.]|uniref:PAS domain-containing sensor histidine kinase n=1 Tax=Sulfuricurvum sp. TaxID=2025608 RepID=UPI002E319E72|nr:PAS domain-containing protein [Sulfuricurvum sp.]HEX5329766.1 PAS domain-containing protein [Sulfuricurvum sp.]
MRIDSHPRFIAWLRENESWLMERILNYAKTNGYTRYTSTLLEAWRISIVGLTDSLELLIQRYPTPPSLTPDEHFNDDPASQFGLLEARRHRSRGVNFAMFISLFKYYRQTYHDLIEENKALFDDPKFYYEYVRQFFDRVEIAYSIEWHGRSSEEQIHELSEQNLHLTNEKNLYLTVFDSFSSGAVLLDSFGVITNYNQSASEVLFDQRQSSGHYYYMKHKTVSTPEWIFDAIGNLGDREKYRFTYDKKRVDGSRTIYDVFIRPLDDVSGKFSGYVLILNDITELECARERFDLAISGSRDGLWDWNLITNEIYFSPRWKTMLGYRDEELPNRLETWSSLVHPDDLKDAEEAIETSIANPEIVYENIHRLRHKEGHYIWNLDRGQVIYDEEKKPIRMVGFHTDITQRQQMLEEIQKTKEMMIAQSRHAAMGEMIGMIAHQWRQPLSTISMSVNNMLIDIDLEELEPEACKKIGEDILGVVNYLSQTIELFRDFFRPNKEKESIRIIETVKEAEAMIGASLNNHAISLEIHNDSDEIIETYSRELLQVFINILNNAKEALVSNLTFNGAISIQVYDEEDEVVTQICNNGGTIGTDILPRIFDPYFSTKDEKAGTGLGLYMSKTIIEKHLNGSIDVENIENGVCFTIRLPKKVI